MRRTFVIGCPRSGTTLVQALLARHPDVLTLPETAFFEHLYGDLEWRWGDLGARMQRRRLRHRLGFAHKRARDKLALLRRELTGKGSAWNLALGKEGCARQFVDMLDGHAAMLGRSMWIEKTPYHLLYLPEIERHVPGAHFVHVIRKGEDVLASVADANMRFERNGAFKGGTLHWSRRWNNAARIHQACSGQPRHHFVFLEDVVADMDGEWRKLCIFLGLDPGIDLRDRCEQPIADLASEPWKQEAVSGIPRAVRSKAERMFGPQVRKWLHEQLASYEELRRTCAAARDEPRQARCAR